MRSPTSHLRANVLRNAIACDVCSLSQIRVGGSRKLSREIILIEPYHIVNRRMNALPPICYQPISLLVSLPCHQEPHLSC
ncbi:hypothetical protein BOTBODRAFT_233174 [Botryobasidium botryosum FD-172 SS1]|uniref:Uncharacterized protein n=1 Tax=Botryobasidium botryosum (strain FD-172 SS1) TaxID=930990 RepID=A0A067LU93_BOTB1|nr:hypothetical protein BOTBODRAFT_233174 [Botryobasidium botryosum FD-172 SS1]